MESKIVSLELGLKHFDVSASKNAAELLRVSCRDIRRTFDAAHGMTGICLGGGLTPYITVFMPTMMGFDQRTYVRENEREYYEADKAAGRSGVTFERVEIVNDTRAQMTFCPAMDWAKIIRFCPSAYNLYYMHGDYRISKAGNPCFTCNKNGQHTLIVAEWQRNKPKPRGAHEPQVRWGFVDGNPPPGVPRYRAHINDFVDRGGYLQANVTVSVPDGYLKFAASTMSANHGAGVDWFIVDRPTTDSRPVGN